MASISIGRYAEEFDDFSGDIDLNEEARAGAAIGHPSSSSMTISVMSAGGGALLLGIGGTKTIALSELTDGDEIRLQLAARKILSSGTSITKCRVTWG